MTRQPPAVRVWLLAATVLAGGVAAAAHHSFDAEFDRNKPVTVTGVVSKVDWLNPHVHVFVDVKDETGAVSTWDFEMAGPNGLMRRGWRRDSLKPGEPVTVTGYLAKNAPRVGNASSITTAAGRKMFAGSSAESGN